MRWKSRWLKKFEWHKFFAWYPVLIDDEYVWLEWVEKRTEAESTFGNNEYRFYSKC